MSGFIPSGASDREEMRKFLGYEPFSELSEDVKLKRALNIPEGMPEQSVRREVEKLASQNKVFDTVFRGAGAYRHYIPAVVGAIARKEEFVTAYTPYQPEISQGILQAIFEYQTLICRLTGMDVSNASVYDGATAAAAASAMCVSGGRNRVLISETVNPQVIETKNLLRRKHRADACSGEGRGNGYSEAFRTARARRRVLYYPAAEFPRSYRGHEENRRYSA